MPHTGLPDRRDFLLAGAAGLVACSRPTFAAGPVELPRADKYFKITVVDLFTGRGVPLVELETVNGIRYWTDSAGVIAFHEPGLMGQRVFFHVKSHGYEFQQDGFKFRGTALEVKEGRSALLRIRRTNVAERLYRVTGAGIYADSVLVGDKPTIKEPLLNAQVFGSDSVVNAVYKGKLYWFWGDTNRPSYPLGNYNAPGATSLLPDKGGLDPERGVDLEYFVDAKGFAKAAAPIEGEGPTWLTGAFALRDAQKVEHLYAGYMKVRNQLEVYERGLAEFNDEKQQFRKVTAFDLDAPAWPNGNTFLHTEGGVEFVYFGNPFPLVRVNTNPRSVRRPEAYQAWTCLQEGTRVEDGKIDRDGDRLRYSWKRKTPPTGPAELAKLVKAGHLKPGESWLPLQDADTGKAVRAHSGSVYWNEYRRRWLMIAVESGGTSFLGEVWYAEGDTPLGPWVYARKVVTHDKYSFYNPRQHPYFDKDGGKTIFFEGTYTHTFSGNKEKTPRYDYNQVMYKLDLGEVGLPVPIYHKDGKHSPATRPGRPDVERDLKNIAFFALIHPGKDAITAHEDAGALKVGATPRGKETLFWVLPADVKDPPATTALLWEYTSEDGKERLYSTNPELTRPGWKKGKEPLCRVWRNPLAALTPGGL